MSEQTLLRWTKKFAGMDFMADPLFDGRRFRLLPSVDDFSAWSSRRGR